jgi:hypothetical protein
MSTKEFINFIQTKIEGTLQQKRKEKEKQARHSPTKTLN